MSNMGNTEAVSQQKLMSSAEISDKGLATDDNTTVRHCDTSSQSSTSTNNEIETTGELEETTPTETTVVTNTSNPKTLTSTSTTCKNRWVIFFLINYSSTSFVEGHSNLSKVMTLILLSKQAASQQFEIPIIRVTEGETSAFYVILKKLCKAN